MDSAELAVEQKTKNEFSPLQDNSLKGRHRVIARKKGIDNELRMSSNQFEALFGNLRQGLALHKIVFDANGKAADFITIQANEAYMHIHGIKQEHIGKQAIAKYQNTGDEPIDWLRVFSRVTATGSPESFEASCPNKGIYYQVYVYSPKKGYCLSIFMDRTEKKMKASRNIREKAEEALALAEQRYRRLFETTQDGIMARDLQGHMIECNPAYAEMLGYSKKELGDLTIEQLLPQRWHSQRYQIVNKVLQTGRSIVFEREYKRKDGSVFPASVRTWRLTDEEGKAIGIWSIVRDISDQKEDQKNLEVHAVILEKIVEERTKQLKNSERLAAIGQTAGMVGHDLRNPLQTIMGELFLAKDAVMSLSENEQKISLQESIKLIEEQTAYMNKIVSDLQAFVQPVKLEKKPLNLKPLVDSVLLSTAIPPNIEVQTQIDNGFPEIKADDQLLKRVLINLVTNAVQAMPNGGKVNLTTKISKQGNFSISVSDTGVGIPDSIKDQIFTPLFTTKSRGQGFGLAVCKRVIEAHGGSITFKSTVGKGAKFVIKVPAS